MNSHLLAFEEPICNNLLVHASNIIDAHATANNFFTFKYWFLALGQFKYHGNVFVTV